MSSDDCKALDNRKAPLSRRDSIRALTLGTVGVMLASGTLTGAALAAPTEESGWRWCNKCGGMFFGKAKASVCPAGGKHKAVGYIYTIPIGDSTVRGVEQAGWRWCEKCQGLFYGGGGHQGYCPAGGQHDGHRSYHFSVMQGGNEVPDTQDGWRFCGDCYGMYYPGAKNNWPSRCPGNGARHVSPKSYNYAFAFRVS